MKLRRGKPEEVGMSPERIQRVFDLSNELLDKGDTQAIVMVVARKGVVVINKAFGKLPNSQPVELDSVFLIACNSKPIVASAIMMLVEDGLVGINRPVSYYIPEFVGDGKNKVMVHHLLTHTSGFIQTDVDKYAEKKKETFEIPSPEQSQHPLINESLWLRYDAPLSMKPGTEMSYGSLGYELLGEIVRRASGKNIDDFTRERIFEPLGMTDTGYIASDSIIPRVIRGLDDDSFWWYDSIITKKTPWSAYGGFSTAMDMAIFGQMLLNQGIYRDTRILSPLTVAAMTRNQIPCIGARYGEEFFPEAEWGLGWSTTGNKKSRGYGEPLLSQKAFCHGGGAIDKNFSHINKLAIDPVYDTIISLFYTSVIGNVNDIKLFISDLFINSVMASINDL
jgi:serine-type D-Ala-D-Ala carboxypeptidase